MKAGDKITFRLHYEFSNNGQRPWYWVKSFHYFFNDDTSRQFFLGGDTLKILNLVEFFAERDGLNFREIQIFDNIHKKEYLFMETN